eukprot:363837-Chlamydomonas_euryale.AAC.8
MPSQIVPRVGAAPAQRKANRQHPHPGVAPHFPSQSPRLAQSRLAQVLEVSHRARYAALLQDEVAYVPGQMRDAPTKVPHLFLPPSTLPQCAAEARGGVCAGTDAGPTVNRVFGGRPEGRQRTCHGSARGGGSAWRHRV